MSAFGLKKVPKIASTSKGFHGNWEWIYLKFSTCRLIGKWEKKWTNPGTYGTSPDAFLLSIKNSVWDLFGEIRRKGHWICMCIQKFPKWSQFTSLGREISPI